MLKLGSPSGLGTTRFFSSISTKDNKKDMRKSVRKKEKKKG
jgi:hypothetical protein